MRKNTFLAAAVFMGSLANAQEDSTGKRLSEVVVTANKFQQKQNTTGKVITVITKEQIEKSSGRTIGQLLNEQAGLTIAGALNNIGSNQTIFMRGASSGRTLVLIDGVPVMDPSLINNEFDLNLLSLNNVESIEICRGAQSTLYGSDAVAGVINIITTKQDITRPVNIKATVTGGSFGTYRGNVQVFGKQDRFTYTTRYAKLVTKGFSAAYDSTGKNNFDRDGYNGDVAQASLGYQATQSLSFRTFAQYSRYNNDLDNGAFVDERDYTLKNKSLMAGAGFRFVKEGISLTGNYQYSDVSRNYLNDSLHQPSFAKFAKDQFYGKNQFAEVFATFALSNRFTLLQGADYRHNSMNSENLSISSWGPFRSQFRDTAHSQSSLYSSLIYKSLNERLNIELGGRLNVHSRYGSNRTFTFNPSYSINEHFRVFGSVATGFKAPTLYQLFSSYGRQDLKPEESRTYEAGVQQQHQRIRNRIVFFRRTIENGIDFNNVVFKYFNFTYQKVKGIELESTLQPIEALTIAANYTYLRPEEKTQSRITFKDTTYNHLLRRPAHNINVTAGYKFDNGLFISVTGKIVSNRYDVGGWKAADVLLDNYYLLNSYAEFKFKRYAKVFVDLQNLTNRRFFDVRGYNAIPFVFNTGLTFEW